MNEYRYLEGLIERYPVLESVKEEIGKAYEVMKSSYEAGGKLLVAGNGGSCADAEHIVGELMKGFIKKRPVTEELKAALVKEEPELGAVLGESLQMGLPAIALTGHASLSTAVLNDIDGELAFAQQVLGYGRPGDVLLGISTSGNAKNVLYALTTAKAIGMKVIGLTGKDGGLLSRAADVSVVAPEQETYKIQELHLPIYHTLCLMLEERFF